MQTVVYSVLPFVYKKWSMKLVCYWCSNYLGRMEDWVKE